MERAFYARDPARVARDLLGCVLVHDACRGRIVETEAYRGRSDPASHAADGRTDRNEPMYGGPGRSYVYVCYGIHTMFNVVTGHDNVPGAVLVRAAEPLDGVEAMQDRRAVEERDELCSGPGKLCEAFAIIPAHDATDLLGRDLRIETGPAPDAVARSGRIGVSEGEDEPLRFCAAGNPHVSTLPRDVTTEEL